MTDIPYSFNDVYEPVFIKNSETLKEKWLKVTQEDYIPQRTENTSMENILKNPIQTEKRVAFALMDPSLYKCRKCGAVKQYLKKPEFCIDCEKGVDFDIITESMDVPKNIWKLPTWENTDIDMFNTYVDLINLLKKTIRFVEDIQYKIFALWIIATYKHPLWETIPYLHFKGLPASGKTRAMEMANLLAYRAVMVSGITFTAIVRINHNYNASLLIDEIDTKLDERGESGREYVDFLKSGYKKGSMYISSDLNDQKKVLFYNNYGPKILTGEKGIYNEALLSRTITFDMEQDYPEIMNLSDVKAECEKIKNNLLNYRFKTGTPETIGEEISLRARYREIFDCLIRTALHIGQPTDDLIKYAKDLEQQMINDMQGTIQWDVLRFIFDLSCTGKLDAPESIKLSSIMELLEWDDEPRKNSQKLGYILKNFGLSTKKKKDGTWLSLVDPKNDRKLKYLFKRYKIGAEVNT